MKTIEKMAEALTEYLDNIPTDDGWWCPYCGPTDCKFDGSCDKCGIPIEDCQPDTARIDNIRKILTTYQAEKALLEKTADWHEHGTVAPSCVGCPTAKAMIEGDWVMVRRERLIATLRNKKIHVYKKVNYFPGVEHVKTISTIEEQLAHLTETEE